MTSCQVNSPRGSSWGRHLCHRYYWTNLWPCGVGTVLGRRSESDRRERCIGSATAARSRLSRGSGRHCTALSLLRLSQLISGSITGQVDGRLSRARDNDDGPSIHVFGVLVASGHGNLTAHYRQLGLWLIVFRVLRTRLLQV
jgi:hypothetical protein